MAATCFVMDFFLIPSGIVLYMNTMAGMMLTPITFIFIGSTFT